MDALRISKLSTELRRIRREVYAIERSMLSDTLSDYALQRILNRWRTRCAFTYNDMKSPISEAFHASIKRRKAFTFDMRRAVFRTREDRDGFIADMRAAGYAKPLKSYTCAKGTLFGVSK